VTSTPYDYRLRLEACAEDFFYGIGSLPFSSEGSGSCLPSRWKTRRIDPTYVLEGVIVILAFQRKDSLELRVFGAVRDIGTRVVGGADSRIERGWTERDKILLTQREVHAVLHTTCSRFGYTLAYSVLVMNPLNSRAKFFLHLPGETDPFRSGDKNVRFTVARARSIGCHFFGSLRIAACSPAWRSLETEIHIDITDVNK